VLVAVLLTAACADDAAERDRDAVAAVFTHAAGLWIDLSHPFSDSTIYWPTDTLGFRLDTVAHGVTPGGFFYSAYRYSAAEHGGTHLDAPVHFAEGGRSNDALELRQLIGPAVMVDVSGRAAPDYQVTVEDFTAHEATHGEIPAGALVLVRTGWEERATDRTRYLGTSTRGPTAVAELHFPGISPAAADWLVRERRVGAVGIDTPSIDHGQSTSFGAHVIFAAANVPGFENLTNLGAVHPTGSYVVALPMKIRGGSGGPLRIVAYNPER
jgi:kynurenine formamidase